MGKNEQYEPSADARKSGVIMYDMFQGLMHAGFNEQQALTIIGQTISASVFANTPPPKDEDDGGN